MISIILIFLVILIIIIFFFKSKKKNMIIKNRDNLIVGNKCNIKHPQDSNKLINGKISKIKEDIIFVDFKYTDINSNNICSKHNYPFPRNEIFPYE